MRILFVQFSLSCVCVCASLINASWGYIQKIISWHDTHSLSPFCCTLLSSGINLSLSFCVLLFISLNIRLVLHSQEMYGNESSNWFYFFVLRLIEFSYICDKLNSETCDDLEASSDSFFSRKLWCKAAKLNQFHKNEILRTSK